MVAPSPGPHNRRCLGPLGARVCLLMGPLRPLGLLGPLWPLGVLRCAGFARRHTARFGADGEPASVIARRTTFTHLLQDSLRSSFAVQFDPFRTPASGRASLILWSSVRPLQGRNIGDALPRDSLTLIPRLSMIRLLQSRSGGFVQAAMPPRKSTYLTPWSERSGDKVRVAKNSKILRWLRCAGFASVWLRGGFVQAAEPPERSQRNHWSDGKVILLSGEKYWRTIHEYLVLKIGRRSHLSRNLDQ